MKHYCKSIPIVFDLKNNLQSRNSQGQSPADKASFSQDIASPGRLVRDEKTWQAVEFDWSLMRAVAAGIDWLRILMKAQVVLWKKSARPFFSLIIMPVLIGACVEKGHVVAKENRSCRLVILPPQGQSVFFVGPNAEDTIELIDEMRMELAKRCKCSLEEVVFRSDETFFPDGASSEKGGVTIKVFYRPKSTCSAVFGLLLGATDTGLLTLHFSTYSPPSSVLGLPPNQRYVNAFTWKRRYLHSSISTIKPIVRGTPWACPAE